MGGIVGRGGIKMVSASTPSSNEPSILVHTVQIILLIKVHFSGRMISSGISEVEFTSVHYEETCLKKLIMIITIIILNESQKLLFLVTDFRYETNARKMMVDFKIKFDALYR